MVDQPSSLAYKRRLCSRELHNLISLITPTFTQGINNNPRALWATDLEAAAKEAVVTHIMIVHPRA